MLAQVIDLAVERRSMVSAVQHDPVVVRLLAKHEPFRELMDRLSAVLTGGDTDADARVRAAMVSAAIGGAVTHPLVADLDDDDAPSPALLAVVADPRCPRAWIVKAVRGQGDQPVLVDVEDPPGQGELLTMRSVGICASDQIYLRFGTERILGHELAGVWADGAAVVVEGLYGCGDCDYCLDGQYNLCDQATQQALGIFNDGGMAERFRAPVERLVELPAGLDVRSGSLVEPAAVAWHGRGRRRPAGPAGARGRRGFGRAAGRGGGPDDGSRRGQPRRPVPAPEGDRRAPGRDRADRGSTTWSSRRPGRPAPCNAASRGSPRVARWRSSACTSAGWTCPTPRC